MKLPNPIRINPAIHSVSIKSCQQSDGIVTHLYIDDNLFSFGSTLIGRSSATNDHLVHFVRYKPAYMVSNGMIVVYLREHKR
jgi:hypothetical protein